MRYIKAEDVLPVELLAQVQRYVDGTYIYIPRKQENKRSWGEGSGYRGELRRRNQAIRSDHRSGAAVETLAEKYHLSPKSIARILRETEE